LYLAFFLGGHYLHLHFGRLHFRLAAEVAAPLAGSEIARADLSAAGAKHGHAITGNGLRAKESEENHSHQKLHIVSPSKFEFGASCH
jgi:hypothetical protein